MLNEVSNPVKPKATQLLYEFDRFRVDVEERVLLRDGNPVPLTPKVFDTLVVLLKNNGHALEKRELMDAIWPESFVEEVNLAHNISALRKVLGESSNSGKFIETLPKRGYRFTCDFRPHSNGLVPGSTTTAIATQRSPIVRKIAEDSQVTTTNFEEPVSETQYGIPLVFRHRSFAVLLIVGSFITAIGLGYYYFRAERRVPVADVLRPIESIAVLPFTNESGDASFDYLSVGLSESLIDRLAQLPQIKVIARNSSFKYRGDNLDLQAVGNALGVEAMITGRVMQHGNNLSVRVEMIDMRDNRQLWSDSYDRPVTDAQTVQSEIARTVSEKLRLRLTGVQEQQLAKRDSVNPEAYEMLLKGRFSVYNSVGRDGLKKAIEFYDQAISLDPNYALAYAELSTVYRQLGANSVLDQKELTPKAEAAAFKALELDENLAEAHVAMANLKRNAWQWSEAERQFKVAIELNPNLRVAHSGYSQVLSFTGRHDQAIAEAKRARELDPIMPSVTVNLGQILFFARRNDEALEATKKALELNPDYLHAYSLLGDVYSAKGMHAEAIAAYQKSVRTIDENTPIDSIYVCGVYFRAGQHKKARAILKRVLTSRKNIPPGALAPLYAVLGDREKAFASLENAYAERDVQLVYLGVDPSFDGLRDDPRFQDLLRRIGLSQS